MFSKIYNYIKKSMKENSVYICIYIFLLFIILCPVNYYIITGGGCFDASKRVSIDTKNKIDGSFNMAYVKEIKGTIFTYLLSYIVPSYDRDNIDDYKGSSDESKADVEFRNTLWLEEANNSSIYVAYKKAGKKVKVNYSKLYVFYKDEKSNTNLKVGDEVLSVAGEKIADFSDFKKIIQTFNTGDKVDILVKRDKKELKRWAYIYEEDNVKYVGISLIEDASYEVDPEVTFKFKKSESGPSGGLIMSLQIYNMLVKEDITKGRKIVGTGTISKDGTVGEIDGVKYKLRGAVGSSADIFIVANGRNYKEALKEKKKNNYSIKIIGVDTFDEAIEKLAAN